jgi:peptidoglycan hydrolase CwlO-like protein
MPASISTAIAVVSVIVAVLTWLTSARKSRVDSLVAIIDSQAKHISRLESSVSELQQALERANSRITELEAQNHRYRRKLLDHRIDPEDVEINAT